MTPSHRGSLKLLEPAGAANSQSDDALMALAAGGDSVAFTQLVCRHERSTRRLCELVLRDSALARDVAQHTFMQLWDQRRRYTPRGRFRELLFTIARNEARRLSRRRSVMTFFGLAAPAGLDPPTEPAADQLSSLQDAALVRAALERLPENFRVPLVLRFIEGLSHEEIAAVIGRTTSAARSRVHYGLKALAELFPEEVSP